MSKFVCRSLQNVAMGLCVALGIFFLSAPTQATTIERVVSPGGIEAWLVEDHSIPVVSLSLSFLGGSALDPADKPGLAAMVSSLIDEGAGDLDSKAFQKRLADLSITLNFDVDLDAFSGQLKTLRENYEEAFSLLALALNEPRFDAEPIERIRGQFMTGFAFRDEDPEDIANRAWFEAAFPDHPYGRASGGEPEGIKAVTAADMKDFTARRFGRDVLIIGVAGDITAAELAPLLDATFGGLPSTAASFEVPSAEVSAGGVIVIEKDNPQSTVRFGENGIKRNHPDFFAARLLNYVLGGGGFNSRLTEEVREKRGLAYSIYSYLQPQAHGALISGGVGTENSRVAETIDIIRQEWRRLVEGGISDEELKNAKAFVTGSFPLQLTSTGRIARMLVTIQYFDLGIDYLDRRDEIINAVTQEDVKRVARDLFDADDLLFVIVGRPEGIEQTRPPPPRFAGQG